jgi:hypothetical protein
VYFQPESQINKKKKRIPNEIVKLILVSRLIT